MGFRPGMIICRPLSARLLPLCMLLALLFMPMAPFASAGMPHLHAGIGGSMGQASHHADSEQVHVHDISPDDSAQMDPLGDCPMCPSHAMCGVCGLALLPDYLLPSGPAPSTQVSSAPASLLTRSVAPPDYPPRA